MRFSSSVRASTWKLQRIACRLDPPFLIFEDTLRPAHDQELHQVERRKTSATAAVAHHRLRCNCATKGVTFW